MFDKLALDLIKAVGWPAVLLVAGGLLDFFCSPATKKDLSNRISGHKPWGGFHYAIEAFRVGLLDRLVGRNLISLSFFLRSALISILVVAAIIFLQIALSQLEIREVIHVDSKYGYVFVAIILSTNIFLDFVANYFTVNLVRACQFCKKKSELFVILIANISLTVTLFTFLFPVSVTVCFLLDREFHNRLNLVISDTDASAAIAAISKFKDADLAKEYLPNPLTLTPLKRDLIDQSNLAVIQTVTKISQGSADRLKEISKLLGSIPEDTLILGSSAEVSLDLGGGLIDKTVVWRSYSAAFDSVEIVRSGFMHMIRLQPIALRFPGIYTIFRALESPRGYAEVKAKCESGLNLYFSLLLIDLDSAARSTVEKCHGDFSVMSYFPGGGSFNDELRRLSSNQTNVPLSAFFMSTFTISLLFYFGILITYLGIMINACISRIFGSNILRNDELPFTIISGIAFAGIEAVAFIVTRTF